MAAGWMVTVVMVGVVGLAFGAQVVTRPGMSNWTPDCRVGGQPITLQVRRHTGLKADKYVQGKLVNLPLEDAQIIKDDPPTTVKPKKVLDAPMSTENIPERELDAEFWRRSAHNTIREKLETRLNLNQAKNGIFFIGDGMSLATVMAARTFAGQRQNRPGEETKLEFEKFPISGLAKTYCVDAQVADSACTATAYLTGVKTKYGTIGMDGNVTRGHCPSQLHRANHVQSILTWALKHGLDTGFVTTTRVTHASPAGTYAHAAERDWESDADLPDDVSSMGCRDIATQLIEEEPGRSFKVILGGGRREFIRNLTRTLESPGRRLDGVDLTRVWRQDKEAANLTHHYVTDRDGLMEINNLNQDEMPEYLLGLFHDDHMDYHLRSKPTQPTLEQMTEVAIRMLSRNPKGYFLFVEGGRIDHAHHDNYAHLAMDETVEYSKAVKKAVQLTSEHDTLVVVSSDHAHTMTVAGYPSRGNDILGVVDTTNADDGVPYTTLSYANGIGYRIAQDGSRFDVTTEKNFTERDVKYKYPGPVFLDSETHGGEDVAVWARGPWQHLFTSTYEQNVIPHLMAFAMCISEAKQDMCHDKASVYASSSNFESPSLISIAMSVIFLCKAFV